jgi:hypothetical protein
LKAEVVTQLRQLFGEKAKVRILTSSQQPDQVSCGVYTIASVYLLCMKLFTAEQLSCVEFDCPGLWQWLFSCLKNNKLTVPPFHYEGGCDKSNVFSEIEL